MQIYVMQLHGCLCCHGDSCLPGSNKVRLLMEAHSMVVALSLLGDEPSPLKWSYYLSGL